MCAARAASCSEQHFSYENFPHFCLRTEACEVEQAAITSGVEIHALFGLTEGVAQWQGEQDAKKCRGENTALFNTALDGEGVRE